MEGTFRQGAPSCHVKFVPSARRSRQGKTNRWAERKGFGSPFRLRPIRMEESFSPPDLPLSLLSPSEAGAN